MKLTVRTLAIFAASAALILASCAPATDAKEDEAPKNKVLSVAFTGTYSKPVGALSATTDITGGVPISFKVNAPSKDTGGKGGGVVIYLIDSAGLYTYYWVAGTDAWATVTLSTDASGIFLDADNKGWSDTGFDPTKVVSFGFSGFEHPETVLIDDVLVGTAAAPLLAADFEDKTSPFTFEWDVATVK